MALQTRLLSNATTGFLIARLLFAGKSRGNWSKRYFVVTNYTLKYYSDASRMKLKGEIVLVGSSVKANDVLNKKRKFHFSIVNPKCGTRNFYAITNNRKEQWLNKLTEVIAGVERSGCIHGTLHKKGGVAKNTWQERWCVLAGPNLDYYENCTDSLPKGTIGTSPHVYYVDMNFW